MPSEAKPSPDVAQKRFTARRMAVWAAVALGAAALVWFSFAFAIPYLRARSAVRRVLTGRISPDQAVDELGGPAAAAERVGLYLPWAWKAVNRSQAAVILGGCGREGVGGLAAALSDDDARVRRSAADALVQIGPDAAAAAGALESMLDDPAPDVARSAAEALGGIGPEARGAAGALAALAGRPGAPPDLRVAAAESLGRIGRDASPAVPTLRRLLGGGDVELRIAAAVALCRIGVGDREVLSPLVEALANGDWMTRLEAARTLGRLGALARPAAAALERVARGDNISDVRGAAEAALRRIR